MLGDQLRDQAGNWEISISGIWSVMSIMLARRVGRSDVGLCLLPGFRVPIYCVAVNVSVGRETRLSVRLGLVHSGVLRVLGSDGKEDEEGYEGWLNGGYGSSVCRTRRVRCSLRNQVHRQMFRMRLQVMHAVAVIVVWLNRRVLGLCLGKGMRISFLENNIPKSPFTRERGYSPHVFSY